MQCLADTERLLSSSCIVGLIYLWPGVHKYQQCSTKGLLVSSNKYYELNNTAPNVMLVHAMNCIKDVYGPTTNRQRAAISFLQEWCRQWWSNHGVFHYCNNKELYSKNETCMVNACTRKYAKLS